jgi:hypothetical protein
VTGCLGFIVQQHGLMQGAQVEDVVPDRDPATRRARKRREHAEGQVLDRKVIVALGGSDPAPQLGVMGRVEVWHGCDPI